MNFTTAIFLINKDVRGVVATYEDMATGKNPKTMFKTFDKTIKVGDLVVVPTSTRHGMTVVKIAEVDVTVNFEDAKEVGWVVSKVDVESYEGILKKETEAMDVIRVAEFKKKREELGATLAGASEEIKALSLYSNGK